MDTNNRLYTIGYSTHTLETFVSILKKNQITAVVDVRSSPYSQYKAEFNREPLKTYLQGNNISYVFLGNYCGARVEDSSCYVDGKVDFNLVSKTHTFKEGISRIIKGIENYNVVLMCAEKDPITCHRFVLVSRNLLPSVSIIKHIISENTVENHKESEQRMLKLHKLNHAELFRSDSQILNDAYERQGKKIAYEEDSETKTGTLG
jgi:uncharacterized protein (DUF488 family)